MNEPKRMEGSNQRKSAEVKINKIELYAVVLEIESTQHSNNERIGESVGDEV